MSIYKKLFEAKKEIGKISKDSTNPFYKSKYFDINQLLEHVEPILQKHELLCLQPIIDNVVTTEIIDVETSGKVTSGIALTNITDPQKRGSEITYYRRYTLASLLGMQAEDDDANKTVRSAPKEQNSQEFENLKVLFELKKESLTLENKERIAKILRVKNPANYSKAIQHLNSI